LVPVPIVISTNHDFICLLTTANHYLYTKISISTSQSNIGTYIL
jgi:hypothetical protein